MAALIHGSYLQALNKTTTLRWKNIKFGKFNSLDFSSKYYLIVSDSSLYLWKPYLTR